MEFIPWHQVAAITQQGTLDQAALLGLQRRHLTLGLPLLSVIAWRARIWELFSCATDLILVTKRFSLLHDQTWSHDRERSSSCPRGCTVNSP
jgi:hypothetical protein